MPYRKPDEEEIEELKAQQLDPSEFIVDVDANEYIPAQKLLSLGYLGRTIGRNIAPALGSGAGYAGGIAATPAVAAIAGPAAVATPLVGAVGGGMIGAKLQDVALRKFAPDWQKQLEIDQVSNPRMSTVIGALTSLPFSGGTANLPASLARLSNVPVKRVATIAGIQGGLNVGQQVLANQSFDPRKIDWTDAALATVIGTAGAAPGSRLRALQNTAARRVGFSPTTADTAFPRIVPERITSAQDDTQFARPDFIEAKAGPLADVTPEVLNFYRTGSVEELAKLADPLAKEIARIRKLAPTVDITPEVIEVIAANFGRAKAIDKKVVIPALAKENAIKQEETLLEGTRTAGAKEKTIAQQEISAMEAEQARIATARPAQEKALQESLAAKDSAEHEAKVAEYTRKTLEAEAKAKEEATKITEQAKTALEGGKAEEQANAARAKIIEEVTAEQKTVKSERKLLQDTLAELVNEEGMPRDSADRITTDKLKRNIGELSRRFAANAERLNAIYADEPISPAGPERLLTQGATAPRGPTVIPPSGGMPPMPEAQGSPMQIAGGSSRPMLLGEGSNLRQGDRPIPIPVTPPLLPAPQISGILGNKPVLRMPASVKEPSFVDQVRAMTKNLTSEQSAFLDSIAHLDDASQRAVMEAYREKHRPQDLKKKGPKKEVVKVAKVPSLATKGLDVKAAQKRGASRRKETGAILPSGRESRGQRVEELSAGLAANVKSWSGKLSPRELIRPALSRIYNSFPEAGDALFKLVPDANAHANPMIDHVLQSMKGLNKADIDAIHEYRADKEDGVTPTPLPDHLIPVEKALDDIVILSAVLREGGPLVKAIGPNGETIYRPNEITPGFNYHKIKDSILKVMRSTKKEDSAQRAKIREDFIQHEMDKTDASLEDATAIVDRKYFGPPESGSSIPNLAYEALRYEQGVGIPRQYRDNVFAATIRGLHRQGLDMSIHKNIESRPEIGKLFGYTEDGKGNKYPEQVLNSSGKEVLPMLGGHNEDSRAIFNSLVYNASPASRTFETANRAASSLVTGTVTQVINLAQLPGTLAEYYSIKDLGRIANGVSKWFSKDARTAAIRNGAVNPGRNIGMNVTQDANDVVNRFVDGFNKGTGAEKLETSQRVGLYAIADQVAWNRMAVGDAKFFDKFGPRDWRTLSPAEAVRYTAVSIARKQAGTYSFEGLPNVLLQGTDLNAIKAIMSLSRWSIERSNHWLQNVWDPLKKGDITPFIKSAFGTAVGVVMTQWIREQLTQRKPKELTWEEWMNLGTDHPGGSRDTANTVLSKINAAGNLGIIGSLGLATMQLVQGEMPYGYQNVALSAAGNVVERLTQFFSAMDKGTATLKDLPMLAFEVARDNIQTLRVIAPYVDESGAREEALARKTGYLPKKPRFSYTLPNPFSETAAYRKGNLPQLTRIEENKIRDSLQTGAPLSGPGIDVRTTVGVNPSTLTPLTARTSTGEPLENYYSFIARTQGEAAALAAKERDRNETIKKQTLYGRAFVEAGNRVRESIRP